MGKFEDENGITQLLMPSSFESITNGPSELFISRKDVEANRRRLLRLFARDCRDLFTHKFPVDTNAFSETEWQGLYDKMDWEWLAGVDPTFFDEGYGPPIFRLMGFKTRALEQLSIGRDDFSRWLMNTQRPLP